MYKFLYAYKNDSKQLITSILNYNNNLSIDRSTYHKKDLIIPHTFYKDLFYKIRNLYNEYLKSNDKYNLIAVDGTYNNTNVNNIKGKLETRLNMVVHLKMATLLARVIILLMNVYLLILLFVVRKIKIKKYYN